MEQRNQALRADVTAGRFLSDLRALRTAAGLDHGQLAARAHYPRDVIAAAEAGPRLPALPVLAAYVRGCGGTGDEILAWEDRWRGVTGSKAHPLLAARVAGLSGASRHLSPENSDPAAIRSALQRFGDRLSQPGPSPDSSRPEPLPEPRQEPRQEAREKPRATVPNPVTPPAPAVPAAPAAPAATVAPTAPVAPTAAKTPRVPEQARPAGTRRPAEASSPQGPGSRGRSARTLTVAAILAALVILLIVIAVL